MKLISWNINGFRAVQKKGVLLKLLRVEAPDILCLQETKISAGKIAKEKIDFPGYHIVWTSAKREGYSGTALIVKNNLGAMQVDGLGVEKFDAEGRIQILSLPRFFLYNIYFPNSNHELSRLGYKTEFNQAIFSDYKKRDKIKPVILTGDFNVAHRPIDLARPKENEGNAGYTDEERRFMDKFLNAGLIDTFRHKNTDKVQYSWWSFRAGARGRNVGWRIDYFLVSDRIKGLIKKAYILDHFTGSDHAPVVLELK